MNAGTAQRIALNLLSSLVMIRLGRVYAGMMVEVQASNEKLGRRQQRMAMRLTGKSESEAQAALERAGGSVKLAVLLLKGYGPRRSQGRAGPRGRPAWRGAGTCRPARWRTGAVSRSWGSRSGLASVSRVSPCGRV